ncbi:MAG: hypothetical protein FWG14_13315 [Peptococcaceae bacterium]|nr:hypothetical protein [Peptococcaceae bacterium]
MIMYRKMRRSAQIVLLFSFVLSFASFFVGCNPGTTSSNFEKIEGNWVSTGPVQIFKGKYELTENDISSTNLNISKDGEVIFTFLGNTYKGTCEFISDEYSEYYKLSMDWRDPLDGNTNLWEGRLSFHPDSEGSVPDNDYILMDRFDSELGFPRLMFIRE